MEGLRQVLEGCRKYARPSALPSHPPAGNRVRPNARTCTRAQMRTPPIRAICLASWRASAAGIVLLAFGRGASYPRLAIFSMLLVSISGEQHARFLASRSRASSSFGSSRSTVGWQPIRPLRHTHKSPCAAPHG
eukprot:4799636-Pleurochrysis_carterae.AAC.2